MEPTATMDKHERKQLARWELNKAKRQGKFEEKVRDYFDVTARRTVETFAKTYQPSPSKILDGVVTEARKLLRELRIPRYTNESSRVLMIATLITMDDLEYEYLYAHLLTGGSWSGSNYGWLYEYDETLLGKKLDVPKTLEAIREHKDNQERIKHLRRFAQSLRRLDTIRDEMAVVAHKFRTIHDCKAIKEELMMKVWHPRRVEHILETYGWEAYENLLGEE